MAAQVSVGWEEQWNGACFMVELGWLLGVMTMLTRYVKGPCGHHHGGKLTCGSEATGAVELTGSHRSRIGRRVTNLFR